jgi:hypothetical protein
LVKCRKQAVSLKYLRMTWHTGIRRTNHDPNT